MVVVKYVRVEGDRGSEERVEIWKDGRPLIITENEDAIKLFKTLFMTLKEGMKVTEKDSRVASLSELQAITFA